MYIFLSISLCKQPNKSYTNFSRGVNKQGNPYTHSIVLSYALSCSPVLSREFSVVLIRSLAFQVSCIWYRNTNAPFEIR